LHTKCESKKAKAFSILAHDSHYFGVGVKSNFLTDSAVQISDISLVFFTARVYNIMWTCSAQAGTNRFYHKF